MLTTGLVALLFLPVYVAVRAAFFRLPLHIDTGFYVSNHTVATGRFDYSRGWNARFAGCSKVLPELFYSFVYLQHCRPAGGGPGACPRQYAFASRFYASLYNYATALAVGALAQELAQGDIRFFYGGWILYAFLSSEPHYGVYFENAEWFSQLLTTVALLCVWEGVRNEQPWWTGAGFAVAVADGLFVKLSSLIAWSIVGLAVVLRDSSIWAWMLGGWAVPGVLYAIWVQRNGQRVRTLLPRLVGHERACGYGAAWSRLRLRLYEKARCLARTARRQPFLLIPAACGVFVGEPLPWLFWVYAAGAMVAYLAQAADCWYYQIPLLPVLTVLATGGVVYGLESGPWGWSLVVLLVILWLGHNPIRALRSGRSALSRWCWEGYVSPDLPERSLALERFCRDLRPAVAGKSVLVYGPLNQAYVLLQASYPTSLVSAEYYLDDMCADWQGELARHFATNPPEFILDSSACFDAKVARHGLGVDYECLREDAEVGRWYRLIGVTAPLGNTGEARTYEPGAVRTGGFATAAADVDVPLTELLARLAQAGYRRVGLYGAGRYTLRHAESYRVSAAPIVAVFDDHAPPGGTRFLEWPMARLERFGPFEIDALIVSTDRFTSTMMATARRTVDSDIQVFAACPSGLGHGCSADSRRFWRSSVPLPHGRGSDGGARSEQDRPAQDLDCTPWKPPLE